MTTLHKQYKPTPSVWSSNHRVRPAYVSDSDSDSGCLSDVDADATSKADASDARLMREIDLSGRHETVEYRPNPWSIARINAASRSSLPKPALARIPGSARSPPKPQPKPIVEAFKRQAKRGPRGGQPMVVRDVNHLGDNHIGAPGVDKSCAAKRDGSSAKKSRQGCESTNTAPSQVRACPQPTEPLDPPSPAHKPRTGFTIHAAAEALEKEETAHISTFSGRFIQSTQVPPPFKPGRIFGTHRPAQSFPVRPVPPRSAPDVGHAVRDRPTFHRSSPGPRSHVPVSGHTMRLLSPLPVSAPAFTNKISSDFRSASPLPRFLGNMGQRTEPIRPLVALDEEIYVSHAPPLPLVPELRQDATDPMHIRTSEPKHKRLAPPEPILARKKPRASAARPLDPAPPTTSTPLHYPTAYTFGEDDDPDVEWSTLAKTKRRAVTLAKRAEKPSGVKQSGCFRLPLLGRTQRTPTRAPEVKRRVITYLPPPIVSKKLVNDVDGGPLASMNHLADEVTAKIDPPTRGPAKHAQVEAEEQEEEEGVEICVMDSDVTLVNEDEEHVAGIDIDDVCVHYPTTRASMKAESRIRRVLGCIVELRV